jgi:predicted ATPase
VIDAAPELAALLAAAPQLRVLATSREALRLQGEQLYSVPPLVVPADGGTDPLSAPAAQLFIARARAARADFAVDTAVASAIAAICRRLDGLPLAIELAAARVRLLPPLAILERLSRPLDLLSSGARDLPRRQQTLRATIAWSYELLSGAEQALFSRLGVFVGGWELAAAEAVSGLGIETLDLLGGLIDKSLVRQAAGVSPEPRYTMLETIREYAVERLEECGEAQTACERHAAYFLTLAEAAEAEQHGPHCDEWYARLETDHDNLRAALGWWVRCGNYKQLARAGCMLWEFWRSRGHWSEGREWLDQALREGALFLADIPSLKARTLLAAGALAGAQSNFSIARARLEESLILFQGQGDDEGRALALIELGYVSHGQSNYPEGEALFCEALSISRAVGDPFHIALSLNYLSFNQYVQGDLAMAREAAEEGLRLLRKLGIKDQLADMLSMLGLIAIARRDYAAASPLLEESLALSREADARHIISTSLNYLGQLAYAQGDYSQAEVLFAESLALRRQLGDRRGSVAILGALGEAVLAQGEVAGARKLHAEALSLSRELNYQQGYSWALRGLAQTAAAVGRPEQAVRLWGAEEALREATTLPIWPEQQPDYERAIAAARAALDEETFAAAWAAGRAMSLEQAIAYALEESDASAEASFRAAPSSQ